ncbi:amidohydrolase family protein [Oceanitalea stevensii]|uniref:Amidohydrolase family protein n=1 Tax=Oceanitalea stevensii TaxID=2763072 RepID=A0ABR8YXJ3_9MICO|nr:amidohydrolase family protein [Oceanitalea stevensii]MBD8060756.1 amidohydrolase family protein [Oceanitalea stevensii]
MGQPLHLTGTIVVGDAAELDECWVVDGRLTLEPPAEPVREVEGWVLPGLVDVHCHIGLGPEGAVSVEEAEVQAKADREAGTLLVRDAGSPQDNRWVQQRSDLPRLIRAGHHLARPKRYLRHYGRELDDVAQLPQAMAEEAASGDGWVKVVADWIDRSEGADSDLRPLWPADILAEGIAAAHEAGAKVTAHAFSREVVDDLLDAGIDGIEHGTGMTADHIAEAARRRVPVTPTLLQVAHFADFAEQAGSKYPVYAARMRAMHERRYEQVRAFHEAGVPLLMGSDAGGTIAHGSLPAELAEVVRAGVPVHDVVAAASWRGRDLLGVPGIHEGAGADVVVYAEDPREDVSALARPRAVVLRGELY